MSRKVKEAVVWFRFKFRDTLAARMQIQRAADKLFRLACVTERGQYTEEDVVRMVAKGLEESALVPRGQQARGLHLGSPHAPRADEADPLAGEEFEES